MIRFIFVALFLFLYLILGIPVYLILRLICKINKKAGDYASLRLVQWAFRVILKISGNDGHRRGKHSRRSGSLCR